jgi:hypothetical protein
MDQCMQGIQSYATPHGYLKDENESMLLLILNCPPICHPSWPISRAKAGEPESARPTGESDFFHPLVRGSELATRVFP